MIRFRELSTEKFTPGILQYLYFLSNESSYKSS